MSIVGLAWRAAIPRSCAHAPIILGRPRRALDVERLAQRRRCYLLLHFGCLTDVGALQNNLTTLWCKTGTTDINFTLDNIFNSTQRAQTLHLCL